MMRPGAKNKRQFERLSIVVELLMDTTEKWGVQPILAEQN
jgi:hypothetical protein